MGKNWIILGVVLVAVVVVVAVTAVIIIDRKNSKAKTEDEAFEPGGRSFVWEKEGFGGDFVITLNADGTYTYYEGGLSSYIGTGAWTVNNSVLTMTEATGYQKIFYFNVKTNELVYIADGSDRFLYVNVEDGDRFIMRKDAKIELPPEVAKPTCVLVVEAGGKYFYANLEDNPSAKALIEKLNSGGITVEMHDYGNFEKVGTLPWELPRTDTQITTRPGDIILYQGNQITLYYDENTWNFTRLANIGNVTKEALLSVLGEGDVTVRFSLEWGE